MSPLSLLPAETLLQIVRIVSADDLSNSAIKHPSYPSQFPTSQLCRPNLFTLLFVKAFHSHASIVLHEAILLAGPDLSKPKKSRVTQQLIDRILDPQDLLGSQVRDLTILNWGFASYDKNTAGLVDSNYLEETIWAVGSKGKSLKVLRTPKIKELGVEWDEVKLLRLGETFPALEELFITLDLETQIQSQKFLKALSTLSSLKSLTLRILAADESSTRGGPGVSICHKLATNLFRAFFETNPNSKLQTLKCVFLKWEPIPIQDYILHIIVVDVRRAKGEDGKDANPLEGGYDIQVSNGMGGAPGSENESILGFLGRS